LDLRIDPSSRDPLHQQIVDQVRHQIATGRLAPGDRLPPVRALAQQLGINVNTAAKAYAEMERGGVLSTAPGRGSFVAGSARFLVGGFREDRLRDLLGRAVVEALSLGYSLEQIEGALALQWARWRELRSTGIDVPSREEPAAPAPALRIAGSHDLALDLLISQLHRTRPQTVVSSSSVGSLAGLIALERGEADVAGCHLVDEETGEYNLPFVRRILPGEAMVLVNLVHRQQGLMVARGNPKGINGLEDLSRPDVRIVNRQRGAGTRVLLDLRLKQLGIVPEKVDGYDRQLETHTAVAAAVASGSADAGLGILSAARSMELDFIPVDRERYDLVIPAAQYELPEVALLLETLGSESYRAVVRELGGYDTADTGREVARIELGSVSSTLLHDGPFPGQGVLSEEA
jgi:molybdate-binding protein/DNA-binding transcriptional regulator YhcF (GntR family)